MTQCNRPSYEYPRASVLLPALLALATVVSTATKVRLPGLPLGIGELLLTAWLTCSVAYRWMATGFRWPVGFATRWGSPFLLCLFGALLLGWLLALALGATSMYDTMHEAVAWAFIGVLTGWFLLESNAPLPIDRYLRTFAGTGVAAVCAILVAAVISRLAFGSQAFWYMGIRLSGWSENPNQFAALLAPLPFVAWHFRARAARPAIRRVWSAGIFGSFLAGLAAQSDALFVAWLLGAAILVFSAWVRGIVGGDRTIRSILVNAVVMPCVTAALLVPISGFLGRLVESGVEERANEGDQAGTRLRLWEHGIDAVVRSPLFGWGPGAHSGINRAFQGTEAHNTFIDLAAQAGVPVSLALISLILLAMWLAIRNRVPVLAVALLALAVLAVFHNVLRQPVFWFLLFAIASVRKTTGAAPAVPGSAGSSAVASV